jgi:hypothetical protein
MNSAGSGIISVLTAIVGVAALAVIFSRGANTASVVRETGNAFADALNAATRPVSGMGSFGGAGIGAP